MESSDSRRILLKTRLFAAIVILSSSFGNFFLTWGMKHRQGTLAFSPLDYIVAIFNPWVMLGVVLLIVWMLSRMALFSWADLSYVLPVTAIGYVISALMGRFFLGRACFAAALGGDGAGVSRHHAGGPDESSRAAAVPERRVCAHRETGDEQLAPGGAGGGQFVAGRRSAELRNEARWRDSGLPPQRNRPASWPTSCGAATWRWPSSSWPSLSSPS